MDAGIEELLRKDRGRINCPLGLDADYQHKICRNCRRSIHYARGSRGHRGYWQHDNDTSGLRWYRELHR